MEKINKKELHEIFVELRNKNQTAYNQLYEKYYNLVYGIAFSILKNKEDSEDVSHEIFTKIYKLNIDKLPTANESSWLFSVTKNECYMFFRKVKPNINIDEIYDIPASSKDLEDVIDIEYYNNLMDGLKEDEKLIVSLKVLSNFTFQKISQVMNIPIGTVQWKYYKAINSLKVSIGSLAGAIVAFVVVFATGELWNKRGNIYKENDINNEKSNIIEENNEQEINTEKEGSLNNENAESKDIISESTTNSGIENNINTDNDTRDKENFSEVLVPTNENFIDKNIKINPIQAIGITIGIVFIIIFLISFKIYQQKLKKKTSK